jgi:hypothetical protein
VRSNWLQLGNHRTDYNGVSGAAPPQPSRKGKAECVICHGLLEKEDWKARFKHSNEHAMELDHSCRELSDKLDRLLKQQTVMI